MKNYIQHLRSDLPSGLVVFLVALPLCLGIALASGAPLFSGLIAGMVGGIVVGTMSGSHLSVSGPAAGLTVIVLSAIEQLGSFESFLLAVLIAGMLQLTLGIAKAGVLGHFFPSSVIKGMLSAIGLVLILKQIPHALGDDKNYEGHEAFLRSDGQNSFTEVMLAFQNIDLGACLIFLVAMAVLLLWETRWLTQMPWTKIMPGPLVAILLAVLINGIFYPSLTPTLMLSGDHLVSLPSFDSFSSLASAFTAPDFSMLANPDIYVIAFTIAIVASLETLLSLEAIDKLDPQKRISPASQELRAQGVGNMVSALLGGLPVTSVIVRSTANVSSGAKTKMSAVVHGILLAVSVLCFPTLLSQIPLSALAAILLMVGYKLAKPALFQQMYRQGLSQFLPFIVTIVAILTTDLLRGITIGMILGLCFVIRANQKQAIHVEYQGKHTVVIKMAKDVSFLNKAFLRHTLNDIEPYSTVIIDERDSVFIDHDIVETIQDFEKNAKNRQIKVEIRCSHPALAFSS